MSERKSLTIIQVKEVEKVGDKQIPKLSFKAKDGEQEHWYFTFKSSLFELIKGGQTINADVETEIKGEYTNRKIVQIYVDGQPIGGKGQQGYRGKSPEELELSARSYALSYAKDLAVADKIPVVEIINQAEIFYNWVKKSEPKAPETKPETKSSAPVEDLEEVFKETTPTGKIQNITELKGLMAKHKVATREAYEILSIGSFMELTDLNEAWETIKKAKKIE